MKETGRYVVLIAAGALLFACGCVQENKLPGTLPSSTNAAVDDYSSTVTSITTVSSITSTSTTIGSTTTTTVASASTTEASLSTTTSSSTTLPEPRPALTVDIKLPGDTFHSGDLIAMDVLIKSPGKIENIGVRIYGIYANGYRLNQSTTYTLVPGLNDVLFTYKAPPCNACAGIAAGKYVIKAEIVYEGKVAAIAMKDVNLIQ